MYLCYTEKSDIKFKEYTKDDDVKLFNLAQSEFAYFYKLCIEFYDIIRLKDKLNLITQVCYKEANLEEIQDVLTLYLTKVKNYLEKWKNKYDITNKSELYKEIERKYKNDKDFLLIYYLRNYEQHNGWIISYYKDTTGKNIEVCFNDLVDLIEKNRISSEDKTLLEKLYPNKKIEINLLELLNRFTVIIKKLHKEMIQIYFINNPNTIYYYTTLYSLLKVCLNKEEGEIYLFEELPSAEKINFSKMIKSKYLNDILIYLALELEVEIVKKDIQIEYSNKKVFLRKEPNIGECIKDQYNIEWLVYSKETDILKKRSKILLIPYVLPSKLIKLCKQHKI